MPILTQLLLQSMNALANRSTTLYYAIVSMFATIGHGYVFIFPILVISSLGLIINNIIKKSPQQWETNDWLLSAAIVITGFIAAWISSKIIKIKPDLPAGKPLRAEDFPALTDRISELCNSFDAPSIQHIKLTPDFRIEIVRTPTNGFPVRYTNTLLIGLPVMSCTSPLQFKLLLARQIGHLAQAKNNYARRIIYLRHTLKVYKHIYSRSWKAETLLLRLFFSWYTPLFNLITITMARLESYHKDSCMLEITPSENAAALIIDFHIKKLFMKKYFWPELNNSAYKFETPPYLPYACMSEYIAKMLTPARIERLYNKEINCEFDINSETPDLKSRLHAIGYDDLVTTDNSAETATEYFFGDRAKDTYNQLDNIWQLKNKKIWSQKYNQGLLEKNQLKLMREQILKSLLSDTEINEYLILIEKYVAPEKALPLYKEITETDPQDGDLCFDLGCLLLGADDSSGINALKTSMNNNPTLTIDCCNHIVEYLVKHDNTKEAQHYRRIILEHRAET